jgi:hypothetical protein
LLHEAKATGQQEVSAHRSSGVELLIWQYVARTTDEKF